MKALLLKEPCSLEETDIPVPKTEIGQVLVKVKAVSVCGSDIHAYKGHNALQRYPRILGHEVCGVVSELSPGTESEELAPGDTVVIMPYLSCGRCRACRRGKSNCCSDLKVFGVHIDGAMTEFISVPIAQLIKIDPGMDVRSAAVVEPLSISAHAVRRAGVQKGDRVLVVGAGPIGLGAAEIAKTFGAEVVIADTDAKRREFVRGNFFYDHVLNPLDADYRERLQKITRGDFPDIIIDSTGNNRSMAASIELLANGGRLVYVGISKDDLVFSHVEFHKRETELLGSRAAYREDFEYVIACIKQGKVRPEKFITHEAPFKNAKQAFESWILKGSEVFKAVLVMD